jgi:hypothetical protein
MCFPVKLDLFSEEQQLVMFESAGSVLTLFVTMLSQLN